MDMLINKAKRNYSNSLKRLEQKVGAQRNNIIRNPRIKNNIKRLLLNRLRNYYFLNAKKLKENLAELLSDNIN